MLFRSLDAFKLLFAMTLYFLLDVFLIPLIARLVKHLALESGRKVLLGYPVVLIGVRIQVSLPMTETFCIAACIAQVVWHLVLSLLFNTFEGVEEGQGGIAFLGCSQIEGGMGKMESPFGQPDAFEGLCISLHHNDGVGIGKSHILTGADEHPAKDEFGIFTGAYHSCQPVERGIRVASSDAFNECTDDVEVIVPLLVVQYRFFLDGLLDRKSVV